MATAAFKSNTKRTPIGSGSTAEDAGSSNRAGVHRRSRSLSRYSGRCPPPEPDGDGGRPAPRGRFVNTVRGSGFPEISLDDLADEFFAAKVDEERGRLGRRVSSVGFDSGPTVRRGRSVSRSHGKDYSASSVATSKGVSDTYSRRRRSVSVARCHQSGSESDRDHSHYSSNHEKIKNLSGSYSSSHEKIKNLSDRNGQPSTMGSPTIPNHQRALRRSLSQIDLLPSHDGYSSYSSALTDDEASDKHQKNGYEKTIRAVFSQKKSDHPCGEVVGTGLFEAMRKEVRHAVDEIRIELEQALVKTKPAISDDGDNLQSDGVDVVLAISDMRKNYSMKLEESEKRKQDLLAELAAEEQRSSEISKIVRELPPESKRTPEKTTRTRKRSNDRVRMSRRLTEEAEMYFEDFISNVEDTDISSIDGEKSDASSTLGGSIKSKDPSRRYGKTEMGGTPERVASLPVEMDGVLLPWLQWETSNDNTPLICKNKTVPMSLRGSLSDSVQDKRMADSNGHCFTTSQGSCSPDCGGTSVSGNKTRRRFTDDISCLIPQMPSGQVISSFNLTEYMNLEEADDLLFEKFRQRKMIEYGGLILCSGRLF
ncbi:hypothetical protein H6P81_008831 [Aristolochia fimbriata]|uniref:Uncharacterized protein n=1 Tax=Aristolochia fimbriata TaxID=158543 RepID=A0AAV7EKD9_ARIFI|nr:hypothetical protein H6P81_008831 [Aristolochia fimbriata]